MLPKGLPGEGTTRSEHAGWEGSLGHRQHDVVNQPSRLATWLARVRRSLLRFASIGVPLLGPSLVATASLHFCIRIRVPPQGTATIHVAQVSCHRCRALAAASHLYHDLRRTTSSPRDAMKFSRRQ